MGCSLICGDWIERLREMPDESVNCCVTSPPYWGLRDYGVAGQLGLEETVADYVDVMVAGFAEVRRVLCQEGTMWLNLGDAYAGSWGAQGRGDKRSEMEIGGRIAGVNRKTLSEQQIIAHPKRTQTGSIARTGGCKPKDLIGIPWMVAFALRADGWYLRSDIIWSKPNPMPESVTDRPTKAHEYLFLMSKSERYYYDAEAIAEETAVGTSERMQRGNSGTHAPGQSAHSGVCGPRSHKGSQFHTGKTAEHQLGRAPHKPRKSVPRGGFDGKTNALEGREAFRAVTEMRNKRTVWTISTQPFPEAHFATFPPKLVEPCILAGCPQDGTVIDPFSGAGTTGLVATRLGRNFIGIELNPDYVAMSKKRIEQDAPLFNEVSCD